MKELLSILDACAELESRGEPAVLATVVKVSGSTYRRPGARMLAARSGRRVGSISGGCLEGDVAERAWKLTEPAPDGSPRASLMTYDAAANDDALWGFGLGCNGVVHVLVERIGAEVRRPTDPIAFIRRCLDRREAGVIVSVFRVEGDPNVRPGARLLLTQGGEVIEDLGHTPLRRAVLGDARHCLASDQSRVRTYPLPGGQVEALVEVVERPLPLVVFGAGHDAVPVVSAARALGWHVTVVDRRSAYGNREHFPDADEIIVCAVNEIRQRVELGRRTAVVVMTHNYLDDQALLEALLPSPAWYVGLLGPRSRSVRLLDELAAGGFRPTSEQLARLRAPVGLDLGAESPEEIAAAVVGEILAARRGGAGGFLRDKDGPIHGGATPDRGGKG